MKLNTIKKIYRELNALNFGGVLVEPCIRFSRSIRVDGFFDSDTNMMGFNLADTRGLDQARELVYHEMIHQYVDVFLGLELEDSEMHGKEFKRQYQKFCHGVVGDPAYV